MCLQVDPALHARAVLTFRLALEAYYSPSWPAVTISYGGNLGPCLRCRRVCPHSSLVASQIRGTPEFKLGHQGSNAVNRVLDGPDQRRRITRWTICFAKSSDTGSRENQRR